MITLIEYSFMGVFVLVLGAQAPLREKEISDALANAQISATREAEAMAILREAELFKQAGKFQAGAEKLREILPLSPDLSIPTLIRASQALDSLLVVWQISSETNKLATATNTGDSENYNAWRETYSETSHAIYNLDRQIAVAKQELWEFDRKQEQHRTMGAYNTRLQMQQKINELETQRMAIQAKLEALKKNVPSRRTSSKSTSNTSLLSPWKYYEKLQSDFREAIRDAKLRDSKRR